jgi:hypothetical protein
VVEHYQRARYGEKVILSTVTIFNADYNPEVARRSFNAWDKKFVCYTYVQSMVGHIQPQGSRGFRREITVPHMQKSEFVKISGYNYFPVIIPRWETRANRPWGSAGPGEIAVGDIITLNEMEKSRLEGVHKLVRPPMVGPASLKRHQASILAGGITYVDEQGLQHGFKPAFQMDPKLYELIQCENEYEEAIDEAFYVDLFRQFSSSESKTHVTAEEIKEKSSEKMQMVAPALGQLDHDQNAKLIENARIILRDLGRLPQLPKEIAGEDVRIEYISILAQAAKASMMNSVERGVNFIGSLSQLTQKPEIIRLLNERKVARQYLDFLAIDPDLIRDDEELDEIAAQAAQEAQAQKQMQMDQQAAATAKDLSQAQPGQGTLLDTWMEASNG